MNNYQDPFAPEYIDDTIDRYLRTEQDAAPSPKQKDQLLHDLQQIYYVEGRKQALQHAYQRIQQRIPAASTHQQAQRVENEAPQLIAVPAKSSASSRARRFARLGRKKQRITLISLIAAAMLVLSAAAFPTIQTLTQLMLNDEARGLALDAYTAINQTQQSHGYKVTLEHAYADVNRILLQYSTTSPNSQSEIMPGQDTTVTTDQGIVLKMAPGMPGTAWSKDPTTKATLLTQSLDGSVIQGTPSDLHLHVAIHRLSISTSGLHGSPAQTIPVSFNFDFTVPFHTGKVITPHQSVTVAGRTITLQRVVITPSETRFYLNGFTRREFTSILVQGPISTYPLLRLNGNTVVMPFIATWDPNDCAIEANFSQKTGPWVVEVKNFASNKQHTWTFHFNVPA